MHLVGGLLEIAPLLVFNALVSVSFPASTVVCVVPATCVGAGVIAIGVSIREQGRVPPMIASVLNLATVVVNIVQIETHSPVGPGPSQLAALVGFAAVVIAAALLLSDPSLRGPARCAIAIPAAGIVLLLVGPFGLSLGGAWIALLPGIGSAIAGVLFLRRTRPHRATARPGNG